MTAQDPASRELADRLLEASLGLFDIATIYVGDRLGLYGALACRGQATPDELAVATRVVPRFVREWCEQQAAAGLLTCVDPAAEPDVRRFSLPAGHREVLADRDGPHYAVGTILSLAAALAGLRDLPDRMRLDPLPAPGDAAETADREGCGEANRPLFRHRLAGWLAAVPEAHDRLLRQPPARVLDVACGAGWSSLAIAAAYPLAQVDAIDLDEGTIALARRHAREAGLDRRVRFRRADAADLDVADPELRGPYDVVTCIEAFHDLAEPVAVLQTWRRVLAPEGVVIVVDVRSAPVFTVPAERLERLAYGWSVVDCLPSTIAAAGSPAAGAAATGAVMRPATLERHALEAGFSGVEILTIEDPGWRFYRLLG